MYMKKLLSVIILLVVLGAMWITRPSTTDHKKAVCEAICGNIDDLTFGLAGDMSKSVVKPVINATMSVDDYYLVTVGRISDKTISVGVFGHVFTMSHDYVRKEVLGL